MSSETKAGNQIHDSSSDKIDLRLRQKPEMVSQENEPSDKELTLLSVDERIKQATDPIFRRVEEICALLAGRTEFESPGDNEASCSSRDNTFASPSGNRYDSAVHKIQNTPGKDPSIVLRFRKIMR